jgi:AcrR family transcriptional regulator
MPRKTKQSTREKLLAVALELIEGPSGAGGVTMRSVAASTGVTAMAIYKHFQNRDALLRAATAAEYPRIAGYFARANARTEIPGLRGMLGYFNYALDHPQLFRYMFSSQRDDALVFPHDLQEGKSPTFSLLQTVVSELMDRHVFQPDDVAETALSIWAHAHGLITLYLCGRIAASRTSFQKLYMRSLDRLLRGLTARTAVISPSYLTGDNRLGSNVSAAPPKVSSTGKRSRGSGRTAQ